MDKPLCNICGQEARFHGAAHWCAMFVSDAHKSSTLTRLRAEIEALRKRVEEAENEAKLARQGYETAYAEFDAKCRVVNRQAAEIKSLSDLLIASGLRTS